MKVFFILAVTLAQGLALPAKDVEIAHFPANIQLSNLPAEIEISNLPFEIEAHGEIEISHLPAEIDAHSEIEINHMPADIEAHDEIEISYLPAEIELPSNIQISHLPAEIDMPSEIEISHLPAELPAAQAESTPNCVKYVRSLLEEVLRSLPGGQSLIESPDLFEVAPPAPVEESACTRCFEKLQLLIEKANSRKSVSITNF